MIKPDLPSNAAAGLLKAGVPNASRHVFVCIGPECCTAAEGEALWECIKARLKETGLKVMRTKAACLRICTGGPWLLVYPEGVWYGEVTPARFEKILHQHLLQGMPVEDWVAATSPLTAQAGCANTHPGLCQTTPTA